MSIYDSERAETDETVCEDLTACTAGGEWDKHLKKHIFHAIKDVEMRKTFAKCKVKRIKNINFEINY